jgi:hypothetical protein
MRVNVREGSELKNFLDFQFFVLPFLPFVRLNGHSAEITFYQNPFINIFHRLCTINQFCEGK